MHNKILEKLPGVQQNILLKDFTTYKIGGPAKYFFIAKTHEELMLALKVAKEFKLPFFILGGGSNLLISDKGFNGLVIRIDILNTEFNGNKAEVGAGISLAKLSYLATEKGLSGLEWATGIPQCTLGGAVYGHAQAFGTKTSDVIKSVEVLNVKTLKFEKFTKNQCLFSLKNSVFKKNKNLIVVSAVLEFNEKDKTEIENKIKEFLEYRKARHPVNFPSAGSTFVNPETKIKNKQLLKEYSELKDYNEKGVIPAGYLIAKCGLVGKKIGNAQISEKHANFVINLGGAKAKDVLNLIKLAKKKVKEKFKINLETEVQFVGFKK